MNSSYNKDRINRPESLDAVLGLFSKKKFKRHTLLIALSKQWEDVVGKEIAAVSRPHSIYFSRGKKTGGTLTIKAESSAALTLQHCTDIIIERIAIVYGYSAVDKIKILQGTIAKGTSAPEEKTQSSVETFPADPIIDSINDDALRQSLSKLRASVKMKEKNNT